MIAMLEEILRRPKTVLVIMLALIGVGIFSYVIISERK